MNFKPIVVAISFSLALFLLLFMVWPKYQELQDLNEKVEQARDHIEQSEQRISELKATDERLQEYSTERKKINSVLPSEAGVPSLLNFLGEAGDNQGLRIKEIKSINRTPSQEGVESVNISLGLVGDYSAFKNFVREVESSARVIEFRQVKFNVPEEEDDLPTFEIKLAAHYYPQ